jgi:NADH:ubiquinone oxidoreductase subunit F (NADH-binding)
MQGFFHLGSVHLDRQPCQGTACFVARHRSTAWPETERSSPRVYCVGRCHAAPANAATDAEPTVAVASPAAVLLERIVEGVAPTLEAYTAHRGYEALDAALRSDPHAILTTVERSGLRGRGGAGFPTGRKWGSTRATVAGTKYIVCNADEGDPGAYSDRVLLEQDPHAVLEGMALAALAVGATEGLVYVRKEYPRAAAVIRNAIAEAETGGVLGDQLLGRGPRFAVDVVDGEGSYVCGEETALLNAIEGRRPEVRARPPYPAEHGLFGAPTVVDNVETLANVGWIMRHGGPTYAALGHGQSRGTKLVSLNSLLRRPGLYEVEFGVPLREIVEGLGGGIDDGQLGGVLIGGPLAGVVPPHLLDTPFAFEELTHVGAAVGHGGVVAFDEHTSIVELLHHVFRFGAYESCGKCTPCRLGAARVASIAGNARARPLAPVEAAELTDLADVLAATSLCGHGSGLGDFARSVLTHCAEQFP